MAPRPKRPTITDVAQRAGVSTATVSRYLNGGKWVSDAAASAVEQAIAATGFVANHSARSLRTGHSATIAFLLSATAESLFADPTFSTLFREISHALTGYDFSLVLLVAGSREEAKRALRVIERRMLDGIILVSQQVDDPLLAPLLKTGLPIVDSGLPLHYTSRVSYVVADEFTGGSLAGGRLIERGCRRVAVVAGPRDTPAGTVRVDGFREAVAASLVADGVEYGDFTRESGTLLARRLLDEHPDLDGIFAASDLMAAGVLDELHRRGLRVPGDVAVIGFDDNFLAASTSPPLTTVRQSFERVGSELVRLLADAMRDGTRSSVVLPVELVVRQSA